MIFTTDDQRVLFFGGNEFEYGRGSSKFTEKQSALYELKITWARNANNREFPTGVKIEKVNTPGLFKGAPTFSQSMVNRHFYQQDKTWAFIDEEGGLHTYNEATKEISYQAPFHQKIKTI